MTTEPPRRSARLAEKAQTSTLPPVPESPKLAQTVPNDKPDMVVNPLDTQPGSNGPPVGNTPPGPNEDTDATMEYAGSSEVTPAGLLVSDAIEPETVPDISMPLSPGLGQVANLVLGQSSGCTLTETGNNTVSTPISRRLWFAVEIPVEDSDRHKFLAGMKARLLEKSISTIGVFLGTSHRDIPSVVVEVATDYQLAKAKKLFPAISEVKTTSLARDLSLTLILLNKAKRMDLKAQDFRSVLEEFGPTPSLQLTSRQNVKVTFSSAVAARRCIEAGAVYVRGRRYVVQPFSADGDYMDTKPVLFPAWLHDLPVFTTDAHLAQVLPSAAVDWQVLKAVGRSKTRPSCFAKVWFSSEDHRAEAVNQTLIFHDMRREWTIPPACSICRNEDHQALLCPQRQVKSSPTPLFKAGPSYNSLFRSELKPEPTKIDTVNRPAATNMELRDVLLLVEEVVAARLTARDQVLSDLTNVLVGTVNGVINTVNQLAQIVAAQSGVTLPVIVPVSTIASLPVKTGNRTVCIPDTMSDEAFDALLAQMVTKPPVSQEPVIQEPPVIQVPFVQTPPVIPVPVVQNSASVAVVTEVVDVIDTIMRPAIKKDQKGQKDQTSSPSRRDEMKQKVEDKKAKIRGVQTE